MGLAFFVLLILTLLAVADPLGNNRASATSEPNSNGNPGLRSSAQNLWCVAKNNADDAALQRALDWACGPGGADCGPIQQGRPCYNSTSFQSTASYAFNDYFRKHGDGASCDFAGTAALASLDPRAMATANFLTDKDLVPMLDL